MILPWTAIQLISEIDDLVARAEAQNDMEVQSDYAKYLTIRVLGLVEQVVAEIVLAHVSAQASPPVLSHTTWKMKALPESELPTSNRACWIVRSTVGGVPRIRPN